MANLLRWHDIDLLTRQLDSLRQVVRAVRRRHDFRIHGWVVPPDHLHCVNELPKPIRPLRERNPLLPSDSEPKALAVLRAIY